MSDMTKINLAKSMLESIENVEAEYLRAIKQSIVTKSALKSAQETTNPSNEVVEFIKASVTMVTALENEKDYQRNRYMERLKGGAEILQKMVGWYEDLLTTIDLQEEEIQRLRKKEKEASKAFDDLYNKMKDNI